LIVSNSRKGIDWFLDILKENPITPKKNKGHNMIRKKSSAFSFGEEK
jgi:hypothetical protein